jgi:hypothetical protein
VAYKKQNENTQFGDMFNKLRDKALLNIVSVKEKAGAKKDLQVSLLTIVWVGVGCGGGGGGGGCHPL